MKILIMDSCGMELKVLSAFLSDQGFEVDSCDRLDGQSSVPSKGETSPCIVILGICGSQHHGLMQVREAVEAYPGVPIVVLADRVFSMDARNPHMALIHAVVRRPIQIEEVEWVLHRLCKAAQTGASH